MYARVHRKGTISTEKIVGSVNAEKMHPKKLAKSTAAVWMALVPLMGLSALPLSGGFAGRIPIPEFLLEHIRSVPGLHAAFLAGMAALHVLLFFCLFAFPAVILDGDHCRGALRESLRLLRGRVLKTALALLACVLAFLLAALVLWAGLLLCSGAGASWPLRPTAAGRCLPFTI